MSSMMTLLSPMFLLAAPAATLDATAAPLAPAAVDSATPGLGAPGQILLGGQAAASIGGRTDVATGERAHNFLPALSLSAARFVTPHLALGGTVGGSVRVGDAPTQGSVEAGPTLYLRAPLGPKVSFLPRATVAYRFEHAEVGGRRGLGATAPGIAAPGLDGHGLATVLDLSVAHELGEHLALTVGPQVAVTWTRYAMGNAHNDLTSIHYGLQLGLLGWL